MNLALIPPGFTFFYQLNLAARRLNQFNEQIIERGLKLDPPILGHEMLNRVECFKLTHFLHDSDLLDVSVAACLYPSRRGATNITLEFRLVQHHAEDVHLQGALEVRFDGPSATWTVHVSDNLTSLLASIVECFELVPGQNALTENDAERLLAHCLDVAAEHERARKAANVKP